MRMMTDVEHIDRRGTHDTLLAFLVIAALAALLYGAHLGNPLFFDSSYWFSEENLRALRDLQTSDRYVSKKVTYWLYGLLEGRVDLLAAVNLTLHVMTAFEIGRA